MIHCQNCTTRNSLNREFCWKCGSRLLVPSGPASLMPAMPFMEEHVLERISALDYSINSLNRRVDSMMETIERVAASNFIDHTMIETLRIRWNLPASISPILKPNGADGIDSRILETEEVGSPRRPHAANPGSISRHGPSAVRRCGSKNHTICWSRTARPKACTF